VKGHPSSSAVSVASISSAIDHGWCATPNAIAPRLYSGLIHAARASEPRIHVVCRRGG
jgi:hypothetical protein